jgi:hypothetical protein
MSSDKKIKIGIMGGRCDCDLLHAPGIPEKPEAAGLRMNEENSVWVREGAGKKKDEMVHSDVAIWWYLKQNYPNVEATLIEPPHVTKEILEANDINFLLGWDAVSAHIDEFCGAEFDEETKVDPGFAENMKNLLRAPSSKCWPPAPAQDLINLKAYIGVAEEAGIPVPPTIVCEDPAIRSAAALIPKIEARGWKSLITKPVPSSWSAGLECFESMKEVIENPEELQQYFDKQEKAKVILAQECISGMEKFPETRVYWFGDELMYIVANIKNGKITDSPESYAYADGSGTLDEKYWKPAVEFSKIVREKVLPELKGFNGQKLSCTYPWVMRIDIGMHDGGLTDTAFAPKWPKGEMIRFLNEVESGPTLYLDARFKHPVDWIAYYTQKCVETAYEVTGIPPPSLLDEMKRKVTESIHAGQAKARAKADKKKKLASSKKTTPAKPAKKSAPAKKVTSKKAAVSKKAVTAKKIAKGVTKTTTTKKAAAKK